MYEQIVFGVLKGALYAEGLDDITSFIGDGKAIIADSENAFENFKAGDVSHVVDGLKDVGDIIK